MKSIHGSLALAALAALLIAPACSLRIAPDETESEASADPVCPTTLFSGITCLASMLDVACPGTTSCHCDGTFVEIETSCVCQEDSFGPTWWCEDDCTAACENEDPDPVEPVDPVAELCERLVAKDCPGTYELELDVCMDSFAFECPQAADYYACAETAEIVCIDMGEYDPSLSGTWFPDPEGCGELLDIECVRL